MLDLQKYSCLGAALRDAMERFGGETCLIEADRDREKMRLDLLRFQGNQPASGAGAGGCGVRCRGSRRDSHDESVEVADFGLCDFLLRRACWFLWITS